jgi:small subunit ribosomal protein S20
LKKFRRLPCRALYKKEAVWAFEKVMQPCFYKRTATYFRNSFREFALYFLVIHSRSVTFAVQKENMANHKATKKDVRQASKRRERNRYYGKTTRNAIRDLRTVNEKAAAGEQLPEVISMIDKLAKKGVIHKNKASNLKSKLSKRVNTLA